MNERHDDLQEIIDAALREMAAEEGDGFDPQACNLAEFCRRTGLTRSRARTVRAHGFRALPHGNSGRRAAPGVLAGHTGLVDDLLRKGVTNSQVIFERLLGQGYAGGLTTVKTYIAAHRDLVPAKRRQAAPQGCRGQRFRTAPGEAYQMDWGFVAVERPGGERARIACFAMVCHHCGGAHVEFFPNARQENLLIGMLHAFSALGVPATVLTDNMKSVVVRRDADGRPVWQADYTEFMGVVGFRTRLCRPRHPLTCIVFSDTRSRGTYFPLECRATDERTSHGKPAGEIHRRVQARDGRLHHLDGQAHHRVLRRARAEFQDGEQVGAEPQARAFRRARPQGRGPRAARGQEAHTRARDGERLLEKSRGLLRQRAGVAARYRLMLAEKAEYPVTLMARILCVSRSGFYSWLSNGCPEDDWSAEREAVRRVWLESDRRFGARFVKCFLPAEFSGLTLYRVRKLMRELGIRGCTPNQRKRTTIPDPKAKPRPDLVRRDFTSPVPTYKLVGDITYLRTGEGWLYLATVIDLNTRMVVGWSLSSRMTADIAVAALESAKSRGYVAGNAIFHTDRGAQYTSRLLAEWARANDVRLSCSRTGNCHDNAVAESFFATLKNEMYYRRRFATRAEARHAVVEFIEAYYNRRRPHSSIGYRVPAEAMADFFERTDPKLAFFERPDPKPDAMPMAA